MKPLTLFKTEEFISHAGLRLDWKIECDALTDEDLATLAKVGAKMVGEFGSVYGIPSGGLKFAKALHQYITPGGPRLIVDDVLTTGKSMKEVHREYNDKGLVIFARSKPDYWIDAIFQFNAYEFLFKEDY